MTVSLFSSANRPSEVQPGSASRRHQLCWEHERIPHIGRRIPLSAKNTTPVPDSWDEKCFDVVWVFDRVEDGYMFSQIPQKLLAGDRAAVQGGFDGI